MLGWTVSSSPLEYKEVARAISTPKPLALIVIDLPFLARIRSQTNINHMKAVGSKRIRNGSKKGKSFRTEKNESAFKKRGRMFS